MTFEQELAKINGIKVSSIKEKLRLRIKSKDPSKNKPNDSEYAQELEIYKSELRTALKSKQIKDPYKLMAENNVTIPNPALWLKTLSEAEIDAFLLEDEAGHQAAKAAKSQRLNAKKDAKALLENLTLGQLDEPGVMNAAIMAIRDILMQ